MERQVARRPLWSIAEERRGALLIHMVITWKEFEWTRSYGLAPGEYPWMMSENPMVALETFGILWKDASVTPGATCIEFLRALTPVPLAREKSDRDASFYEAYLLVPLEVGLVLTSGNTGEDTPQDRVS